MCRTRTSQNRNKADNPDNNPTMYRTTTNQNRNEADTIRHWHYPIPTITRNSGILAESPPRCVLAQGGVARAHVSFRFVFVFRFVSFRAPRPDQTSSGGVGWRCRCLCPNPIPIPIGLDWIEHRHHTNARALKARQRNGNVRVMLFGTKQSQASGCRSDLETETILAPPDRDAPFLTRRSARCF